LFQDFETWDDVGLNIPKPAELHHLYRDYMKKSGHNEFLKEDNSCQTDLTDDITALQVLYKLYCAFAKD